MPIPTDTFWNIKRLNVVFALSAILLLAVSNWAIIQDHDKDWRIPQRQAQAWDLALTDEKIQRQLTPEEQKSLERLKSEIADQETKLATSNKEYENLVAEKKKLDSERATLEFKLNNLKSNVQVWQANLQDAVAAQDETAIRELNEKLAEPQKQVAEFTEELASYGNRIAEVRDKLDQQTAQLDALKKERTKLGGDYDALQKRAVAIDPGRQGGVNGIFGRVSRIVRDAPLMGFVNPAERVQQIVLPEVQTDVAFMKITTIDRCTTCHVNIGKKDYTEEKVLAYLEDQVATVRQLNLPAVAPTGATAPVATAAKPGAVANADFWHNYARTLAPAQITRNNARIAAIARSVNGTVATVEYDGKAVSPFAYKADSTDQTEITRQNEILLALLEAFYRWSPVSDGAAERGKAKATVAHTATGAAINGPRNLAMRYVEELRTGLKATLSADEYDQLEDRYRYALVDELNSERKKQGLQALDASPVILAHPNLELYVDIDSAHSIEAVGCTSCHDGSGQETDFVLAAHTPRNIWVDSKTGVPVLRGQLKQPPLEGHEKQDLSSMLAAVLPKNSVIPKQVSELHFEAAPSTQPSESESESASKAVAYSDPVGGTSGWALPQFDYWKKVYEPKAPRNFELVYHEWDWPMRSRDLVQVNCARCHTDVYDIKEHAPTLYEGRQLFTQMGCVNCHQMDSIPAHENRKVGTDLRHVTSKLSKEYINTWVWAPKAFRPTTKMPHFFMLENNSSDEEIRRTRQEARSITEYLVRTATPLPPQHVWPANGKGNADSGKQIFNTLGCLACHQNLNERGEEWITTDLVKGAGMTADDAKKAYASMTYNQRQIYVQQHLAEPAGHVTKATYSDGSAKPVFVQIGPELSGIGTKLTAGRSLEQSRQWLFEWVMEPRHYSEYTIMPRLRLSDQQAMDLAEYLLNQKRTTNDPNDNWSAGLTDPDTEKLKQLTALQLKSRFSWQTAQVKADDDAELTADAIAALTTPVKTAEQAKAEVSAMSKDEKRMVFLGQKLIANYSCMSCHAINGMETATSPCPNLSAEGEKGVDKLDYGYLDPHKREWLPPVSKVSMVNGFSTAAANLIHEKIEGKPVSKELEVAWPEIEHTRQSWISQKVNNSRIFDRDKSLLEPTRDNVGAPYDKLKMPTFYLNEEQVHAIVAFVLSNRTRLISDHLTQLATNEQARQIARGRQLTEQYNCVSCHQIEKNLPQIQQYFKVDEIPTKAPPSLRGEGNKVQFGWLFNFFKNVEQMRPLIFTGIRMPSFPASDDEWTAILAYFNSVSNKESKQLNKQIDPVVKYIAASKKASTQPAPEDVAAAAPGDDWWQRAEFASTAQALKDWGLVFGHIKPIEVGPTATPDDLRKVYRTLLFKAGFTRELYAAQYPFVDAPRPQISDERFKLGEQFFYEMQCLKCHVLGDPNVNGANKSPTAPNLSLAQRRLQQRWVRHWVQEPNIIQVGTAMPPFFTGLPVFKLDGQSWPRAQNLPEDQAKRIESTYGSTVQEQTALLLDFLYAAGVRGYTGVQPPTSAPAGAASAGP
ncbi:MAG TPA: c-type cytochrome [Tepidisphaeraceae bacterium]|nr:c-type cytochrome [Tepidisphaeraceae bacterium]